MKVGIVGAGFMGTTHAAGWVETGAELVGLAAETFEEARPLADQYGIKIFPDLEAMLPEVDVVDICTPTHLHHEMVLRSAAVEKVTAAVLILHGGRDSFAPVELILPFAEALQRHGKNVQMKVYPDEEHSLFTFTSPPEEQRRWCVSPKTADDVWIEATAFLDRILKAER